MIDSDLSLKARAEQTIINLLNADRVLAEMTPKPQATKDRKETNPRIAVVSTIGQEYEVGSGIFRIPTVIELFYNIPQAGQDETVMEDAAKRIDDVISRAQGLGVFGIIRMGGSTNLNGVTAKRTVSITIIGA